MPASWRSAPRRRGRCSLPRRRQAGAPPRRATRPAGRRRSRGRRGRRPEDRTESRRAAWPRPRRSHASLAACFGFAFAFRVGAGFGFALGFGAARVVRDGVVDVTTGCVAGAGLDGRETAGDGVAVAVLTTTRGFVATGAADEPTTGASGRRHRRRRAATAATASCDFDDFDDDVANAPGGSSGAGIGVPPAAQPAAGQANATRQAPTASESRLSRRDDVHLDTTSPLSESHGTSVDARVSTRARVAAGGRRPPCLACT